MAYFFPQNWPPFVLPRQSWGQIQIRLKQTPNSAEIMDGKSLSSFLPLDSKAKITLLISYLASCPSENRPKYKECYDYIFTNELREFFITKCIKRDLFSDSISRMQKTLRRMFKHSSPEYIEAKKKHAESRRKYLERKFDRDDKKHDNITVSNRQIKERSVSTDSVYINSNIPENKDSVNRKPIINYIVENLSASSLIVDEGLIRYQDFCLKSKRIVPISPSILSLIEHRFKLKRDYQLSSATDKRFIFEPSSDLTLLLQSAEKIIAIHKPLEHISDNSSVELSWENVSFDNNVMLIYLSPCDVQPYKIYHSSIIQSFNDIRPYISVRCPKLKATCSNNHIVAIENFRSFEIMIPQFLKFCKFSGNEISRYEDISQIKTSIDLTEAKKYFNISKSPYLMFLSSIQVHNKRLYYILESNIHAAGEGDNEYGYLFTILENENSSIVIYENTSNLSRSSYVFYLRPQYFELGIDSIVRFWASDIVNKRHRLAHKNIIFNDISILKYSRIKHDDLINWKNRITGFTI